MCVHVCVCYPALREVDCPLLMTLPVGPPEWAGALRGFELPAVCEASFLDGCRIYLTGFSDLELEKLHKIINLGGGVRYGTFQCIHDCT